jgi:hypothetical protein
MKSWSTILGDAALLKTGAYTWMAGRIDAFMLGFLIIVAVALITGIPVFVGDLIEGLQPGPTPGEVDEIMNQIETTFENMGPMMGDMPPAARDAILAQIRDVMQIVIDVEARITALPRPLPAPVGTLFESFGRYASRAFADSGLPLAGATLGTWLGYGIWVMLFAKLLNGRGTLAGFFGATAFFALPFLLTFFGFIPVLGPLLGLIAFIWGVVIYVKATAVSHDFGYGRAMAAVFLPLLIIAALALVFGVSIATLIAISSAGN